MNEMVERVARAICPPGDDWKAHTDDAQRALAAAREPTKGMTAIGDRYTSCGGPCGNAAALEVWRVMIDAALSPAAE